MKLAATSLSQLLKELRGDTGDNKRKHPRVGLRVKTIVRLRDGAEHTVWVRDFSAAGANFVGSIGFQPKDQLHLVISPDGKDSVLCGVIHSRQLQADLFSTGVRFFL